jgi:hypothetical protein
VRTLTIPLDAYRRAFDPRPPIRHAVDRRCSAEVHWRFWGAPDREEQGDHEVATERARHWVARDLAVQAVFREPLDAERDGRLPWGLCWAEILRTIECAPGLYPRALRLRAIFERDRAAGNLIDVAADDREQRGDESVLGARGRARAHRP